MGKMRSLVCSGYRPTVGTEILEESEKGADKDQ